MRHCEEGEYLEFLVVILRKVGMSGKATVRKSRKVGSESERSSLDGMGMPLAELRRRMNEAEKGARRAKTDVAGWMWQRVWGARKRAYEAALERHTAQAHRPL